MMVYHHSGQVKVQNRNWNLTLSVFWMMKIRRTPTPVSEAIAPPLSLRPSACCRLRLLASAHVDVGDLDGVVAVAEAVPGWNLGLHVAGCVGRAGAEAVADGLGRLPCEG